MRSIILLGLLIVVLAAPSPAVGFDSGSTASGEAGIDSPNTPVAASSGTWQPFGGPENCRDWFGRLCSASFPQPQCIPNPIGQPCAPLNSECYRTISSTLHQYHLCV